jgi:DNA-binding beta-propeller fold protein YncE
MTRKVHERFPLLTAGLTLALVISAALAHAQSNIQVLPNLGQQITPLAPKDARFEPMNPDLSDKPAWLAGQAVTTVVSPDHKTLLVLTSGYNRVYNANTPIPYGPDSNEYVFIYDISTPTPLKKQVVQIANSYNGIVFDPSGAAFYVAGGVSDNVHIITLSADGTWGEPGPALALGQKNRTGVGLAVQPSGVQGSINLQVGVKPCAAGVAISNDGQTLVVANYYNDSITVFNGGLGNWSQGTELDLRPGKSDVSKAGTPGGEYPFWVVVKGNGSSAIAYVSSIRDREIDVVNLNGAPAVTARIRVKGQPNKMTLNAAQSLLYVVEDQSDTIDVIDTTKNAILETIPVIAPASVVPSSLAQYTGANPNSVTLSPDEKQLYVTNGNLNSIAVVALGGTNSGDQVVGLIPTGWYPNSVSFGGDGNSVYVINGKSPTGPNPGLCYSYGPATHKNCMGTNQYNPQSIKAGLQSFPRPSTAQLTTLTAQVATNNRFSSTESANDAAVMAAVRQGVQHVIFIIKENRTYDQILGDLEIGNGDPNLAEFGQAVTPNQHNLARNFVTLDNFQDTAEVSNDGWPWTTSARAPDVIQRQFPVAYAGRGLSLDSEGVNRNVNVAYPTVGERQAANPLTPTDPDVLAGQTNVAAPDGPNNEVNTGYLWDAALRANLTVRNYGFFVDTTRYVTTTYRIPLLRDPASTGTIVAFPASVSLTPYTDPFFRGFDNAFPDYYRYTEWAREFDVNYANGGLPFVEPRSLHA